MQEDFLAPRTAICAPSPSSAIRTVSEDVPEAPAIVHAADTPRIEEPGPFLVGLYCRSGHEEGFELGAVGKECFEGFVDEL